MSVRQGILALLAEQAMPVSQLKAEFETRTGGTWPVNIGQVFTTLQRLERDGLVVRTDAEEGGLERFVLTEAGGVEAESWWSRPVERAAPARDELAIKLALAVAAPGVDVRAVVQAQRTETMRALHDYTRLKVTGRSGEATAREGADGGGAGDGFAWSLVLDRLVFDAEAEIRWLDHVEARVAAAGRTGERRAVAPSQGDGGAARPASGSASAHVPAVGGGDR